MRLEWFKRSCDKRIVKSYCRIFVLRICFDVARHKPIDLKIEKFILGPIIDIM